MLKRPVSALVVLASVLLAATAQAQPKPKKDAPDKGGAQESFKLPGAEEPLRIKARYADKKRVGNVELFVASGSVFAWQGDRRYPSLQLTCENLVIWRTVSKEIDPKTKLPLRKTEFYAERNVRFLRRREILFGQRMYFDLDNNVSLIDRARYQARIKSAERLIPLIMRARQFRVLNSKRSLAQDAYFSTSKFGDPSYRFQASNIRIDVDQKTGVVRTLHSKSVLRTIEPRDRTDLPLWYFPYLALNKDEDFPLKELEFGSAGRFGRFLFTRWGQRIGDWGNWFLDLDFSTDRGIGFGPGIEYDAEDRRGNPYRGRLLTYVINDQLPSDETEESGAPVPDSFRYRFNWQHRHELPKKYRLDLELSVLSDRNFLREYFEDELREEKPKETIAYLRKQHDNHQASVLMKYELNDFVTTTEYFPQIRLDTLHEPLKDTNKFLRNLYYTGSHQAAFLRRNIDDTERTITEIDPETGEETTRVEGPDEDDGETAARLDSNNVLAYPFRLGAFGFYPSLGIRPGVVSSEGGTFSASAGMRVTTQLSRLYRVRVPILDVNNLLHVINPELQYTNIFIATPGKEDRFLFDEIDTVDRFHELRFKLLNRLKTRRFDLPKHTAARYPAKRKPTEEKIAFGRERRGNIFEFLYFDIELPIYPEADRDNRGRTIGDLDIDLQWTIRRWWRFNLDAEIRMDGSSEPLDADEEEAEEENPEEGREENVDSQIELDDDQGAGLRIFNISTTFSSPHSTFPRYGVTLGNRYARDISNILFADTTLSVNRKWEVGFRLEYDTMDSRIDSGEIRVRRYFDRIILDLAVERNEGDLRGDDETEFKIRLLLRALVDDDNNAEDFDDDEDDEDEEGGSLLSGLGIRTGEQEGAADGTKPKPKALDPRNSGDGK